MLNAGAINTQETTAIASKDVLAAASDPDRQTASPKSQIIWNTVLKSLEHQFGQTETKKWVGELKLLAEYQGSMIIATKDQLGYFRIKGRTEKLIQKRWLGLDPRKRSAAIMVWADVPEEIKNLIDDPWATAVDTTDDQRDLNDGSISPSRADTHNLDFESLIIGESNRSAVGLGKRLASEANIGGNIGYFHGRQGTGKTHLLKAIEHEILLTRPDIRVQYCSAEDFLAAYVEGARAGDTRSLRAKVRNVDVFLIDDVHILSGKKGTDQELLSTIKSVTQNGGRVALSADVCAHDLVGFSARLLSEFKGAVAVELKAPDVDLCGAILRQRERLIHKTCPSFSLTDEMVEAILVAVRGTGRDIIGILGSIYTETGFGDVSTSMHIVTSVIERYKGTRPQPTISDIKNAVIKHFGIAKHDLEGASKSRHHVYPRHIAMHLSRGLTGKSLPQIAFQFGKRDHTTVLSACRKVKARLVEDRQLQIDIDAVTYALNS